MRLIIVLLFTGIGFTSIAQQKLYIKITGRETRIPISASILLKESAKGYSTDSSGIAFVPFTTNGDHTLTISAIGYEEKETKIRIPYGSDTLEIEMESVLICLAR